MSIDDDEKKMSIRAQAIMAAVALLTFFGGISLFIARSTAMDAVRPISDEQIQHRSEIKHLKESFAEIRRRQEETTSILRQIYSKMVHDGK